MNFKALLVIFAIAAIGATSLLLTLVSAGEDYAKAQNTRIEQMRQYGYGNPSR